MSLEIRNCPDLRFIWISTHQNVWDFQRSSPSLQILWCGVEVLPPVLQSWTSIEELIVSNCPNLISIKDLREELHSLSRLKIENCPNLTDIDAVNFLQGSLRSDYWGELHSVEIENCPNLRTFPRIEASLRRLVLSSCGVYNLPWRLESCEELIISNCRNLVGFCKVQSCTTLAILIISNCPNLERFLAKDLHYLVKLQIKNCFRMKDFVSLEGAVKLQHLEMSSCDVEKLPDGLQSCTSLKELIISNCPNLIGIPDLGDVLHSLAKLEIENCPNFTSFASIQGAASLLRLVMSSCSVEVLPNGLQSCTSLKELIILNCPNLTSFARIQGAASLLRLVMSSCSVEVLPNELQSCTSLEELIISNCPNLISIPDLGDLLHSLTKLEIENCPNLTSFASIQGAASLLRLVISSCGVEVLPNGLQSCTSLEELIISNCPNLIQSYTSLKELRELIIRNCPNLKRIPDFGDVLYSLEDVCIRRIPNLKGHSPTRLEFKDCNNLIYYRSLREATSLQELVISSFAVEYLPIGLQYCTSLQELKISDCPNLIRIPDLQYFTSLQELKISDCPNLIRSPDLPVHSLTRLEFKDCNNLRYFGSLQGATSLQGLVISSCAVEDLLGLQYCTSLQELEILHCPNLNVFQSQDLPGHSLTRLEFKDCKKLRYFGRIPEASRLVISSCAFEYLQLQSCTSLKELEISDCRNLTRILDLGEDSSSLIKLHVTNCPNLKSFGSIQGAAYLHRLTFGVDPLPVGLESCKYIKYLQICGCPNLISFPDLGGVHYLEELEIRLCPRLTSFLSLQDGMSLKRLVITFCESLEALPNGLQSCRDLEELRIWNCDNLKSITDLSGLLSLTELSIRNCRQLRCTSVMLSDRFKTLEIGPFCEELESFPTLISYTHLQHSLERLQLYGWALLNSLRNLTCYIPFQDSLETLQLNGWAMLNSLPEEIQRFTALKFLYIDGFDGILALPEWLDKLFSLRSLTVENCKKLMYFPTAEAMRNLTNLTKLEICDCPKLQETCAEGTGTEWYKIAHIPIIQIDEEYIRGEGYDIDG